MAQSAPAVPSQRWVVKMGSAGKRIASAQPRLPVTIAPAAPNNVQKRTTPVSQDCRVRSQTSSATAAATRRAMGKCARSGWNLPPRVSARLTTDALVGGVPPSGAGLRLLSNSSTHPGPCPFPAWSAVRSWNPPAACRRFQLSNRASTSRASGAPPVWDCLPSALDPGSSRSLSSVF